MNARWLQLAPRERWLVAIGAAILAGGLVYALAWQPLARSIERNETQVAQQRADLAWMRQAALRMRALRSQADIRSAPQAAAGQTLRAVLDAALRTQDLDSAVAARTQGEDGSIRVTFKPVSFDALLRCLAGLQAAGLQVRTIELDRVGAGQVAGSLQVARATAG